MNQKFDNRKKEICIFFNVDNEKYNIVYDVCGGNNNLDIIFNNIKFKRKIKKFGIIKKGFKKQMKHPRKIFEESPSYKSI